MAYYDDLAYEAALDEAKNLLDAELCGIEQVITTHNGAQLEMWTRQVRRSVERTYEVDSYSLGMQGKTTENCLNEIKDEAGRFINERTEASTKMAKYRRDREKDFANELKQAGMNHSSAVAEVVRKFTSMLRTVGEAWDTSAWDNLERDLGVVCWQQARLIHASNPTAGVADVYSRGALESYLAAEKEGWARSQKNDLDRLIEDSQSDAEQVITSLQNKLKRMAPEQMLVKPWIERLNDMGGAERDRLKVLEKEALNAYESEIDAAMWQCTEDYHGYDSELQRILVRCLEGRSESLSQMRELKLALCRWRLDYQQSYHSMLRAMRTENGGRRSTSTGLQSAKLTSPRRFMMVRRLMRRLWTHGKVPYSEIHGFLKKVTASAMRHGSGKDILPLYKKEIENFGATPLIAQASNPDILELWLQAPTLHKSKLRRDAGESGKDLELDQTGTLSRKDLMRRGTGKI